MTSRVTVDRSALEKHIRRSPGANHALDETTEKLQALASGIAPDATGYYRHRFRIQKLSNAGRRLSNTDPFAHLVEWGSINNVAYAPLRRAARALGLTFVEKPK